MELPVQTPRWLADHERWHALVQFPNRLHPSEILIFPLASGLIGVRARCPHEGQDLSDAPLTQDGILICPRHGMMIGVFGKPCASFRVERRDDDFVVPWPLLPYPTP